VTDACYVCLIIRNYYDNEVTIYGPLSLTPSAICPSLLSDHYFIRL